MAAVCMKSYSARQFTDACKCQNPKETIALVEKCFYKYLIFFFSKPKTPKSWSEAVFVLYKQCDLEVWVISEHIFLEAGIWLAVHSLCQLVESCVVYHRFKAKALNRSCSGACGQNENVVIFTTAWKQLGVTQSKGTDPHRVVDLVIFRCDRLTCIFRFLWTRCHDPFQIGHRLWRCVFFVFVIASVMVCALCWFICPETS